MKMYTENNLQNKLSHFIWKVESFSRFAIQIEISMEVLTMKLLVYYTVTIYHVTRVSNNCSV